MADFNPDDLAEISARLRRAEIEETSTVCLYLEMPYTAAVTLVDDYETWLESGEPALWAQIGLFVDSLMESLHLMLEEYKKG